MVYLNLIDINDKMDSATSNPGPGKNSFGKCLNLESCSRILYAAQ